MKIYHLPAGNEIIHLCTICTRYSCTQISIKFYYDQRVRYYFMFNWTLHIDKQIIITTLTSWSCRHLFLILTNFYSAIGHWHVAPLGHITLTQNQSVFALTSEWCMSRGEATNTNAIAFSLTWPKIKLTKICEFDNASGKVY